MLSKTADVYAYRFVAMASPCEVLIDSEDAALAESLGRLAEAEALRIEAKFSRYRDDSVIGVINCANGASIQLDDETADLIDYGGECYRLTGGLFDISSGALRRAWRFDGSDRVPSHEEVAEILRFVGWHKVRWSRPSLTLAPGMEIDLGGLGKEYAVDCALMKVSNTSPVPVLVNFGGDLRVTGPRTNARSWRAPIESVDVAGTSDGILEFSRGALATSGDARRYLLKDGIRYSHILDPRTGWPVERPPRSVTVAAPTCMEAGLLASFAMLQGKDAEQFLQREGAQAWVAR